MAKIAKDDYIISSNLRYVFQKATLIASDLRLDRLNTSCVLLAMIADAYSSINAIYLANGIKVDASTFLNSLSTKKEFYEQIMGVDFPFVGYKIEDNMELFEGIRAEIDEIANCNATNEAVNEKATEIVSIILNTMEEYIFPNFEDVQYNVAYSANLKQAIIDAGTRCRSNGIDYIDDENLLYSILNLPDCSAKRLVEMITKTLVDANVEYDIVDMIDDLINSYTIYFESFEDEVVIPKPLESCCEILNDRYVKGVKCDILGRDEEIYRIWRILSKKQKSNVVLLGEAGVGKSSIVKAITMSIVNGTCPDKFKDYKVVELKISGMVAGTKYRGEFEKKAEYLEEFINNNDNLIIFVDEVHTIIGAGSTENSSLDLSNLLKPLLARDKVKFIGATTLAEYKMYICRDNAFRRRLEPINIKEPKQSQVPTMIKAKVDSLKKYHGVTISKKVLDEIQMYASCFNVSTCNPDKTIDLVDTVMGIAANEGSKSTTSNHIKEWFNPSYEQYEKTPEKVNLNTSYHEAGHFYLHYIYKDILVDQEVYALSILPGFDFLGANILELTESVPNRDREYYEAEIAALLGGRIVEEIFFNNVTTGASNDLGKVGALIRANIIRGGFSLLENDFYNVSLYDEETGNVLPFSDSAIDKINKEVKEITDKVYNTHKIMLSEPKHKANLKLIADILLKKKIVSAKELIEALEKNN